MSNRAQQPKPAEQLHSSGRQAGESVSCKWQIPFCRTGHSKVHSWSMTQLQRPSKGWHLNKGAQAGLGRLGYPLPLHSLTVTSDTSACTRGLGAP